MGVDLVISESDIQRTIKRMAHEIVEGTPDATALVLLGIPTRGATLASRLAGHIGDITGVTPPVGVLDTTLYRDDLDQSPHRAPHHTTEPDGGIDDRVVVLVGRRRARDRGSAPWSAPSPPHTASLLQVRTRLQ